MARTGQIDALGARLQQSGDQPDWARLEPLLRELGPQLQALAAHGPWTASERAALTRLRGAHERIGQACARSMGQVQARIDDMGSNRQGWIAYALAGASDMTLERA